MVFINEERIERIEARYKKQARSKTLGNIIKKFGLNKKSVLDIGCSYGEHLVHFGPESLGVSISKEEVEYAKLKGLNIIYGNIESVDLDIPQNNFDVIFANNIIEHLYSPHNFLCKIKKYLKPDGLLILGVPCIPKITWLLKIKKFRGCLAPPHINFFTKDTSRKTVERAGWDIIELRYFRFYNRAIDNLFNPVFPQFYAVAKINPDFKYPERRVSELMGYLKINKDDFPAD